MAVKIGHASIDENGKVSGGKAGDQTGKEICIRSWYSKPWNVYLECTDKEVAHKAASIMECICFDDNYGYDQGQRVTGYNNIVKNNGSVHGAKGEFDCSSLVSAAYKLAGLNISVSNTTRSLRKALLATGKFKEYTNKKYLDTDEYAKRGGIYLKEGSHVVMALEDGKPAEAPKKQGSTQHHIVKSGDTLFKIAQKYGTTVNKLVADNNIANPNRISIGQKVVIKK